MAPLAARFACLPSTATKLARMSWGHQVLISLYWLSYQAESAAISILLIPLQVPHRRWHDHGIREG